LESIQSHFPDLYTPYKNLAKFSATSDAGWQHGVAVFLRTAILLYTYFAFYGR